MYEKFAEPAQSTDPDAHFHRQWAQESVARAMEKLREDWETSGKGELFEALKGSLTGAEPPRSETAVRLEMTEGAVKVAVHRPRQRYRDLLRAEIAETVSDPSDIDEEMESADFTRQLGPYQIIEEMISEEWILATDPVLRRRVWLLRPAASELSDARRHVARSGRPRWLQTVEAGDASWDAFEATRGVPFVSLVADGKRVPWPTLAPLASRPGVGTVGSDRGSDPAR